MMIPKNYTKVKEKKMYQATGTQPFEKLLVQLKKGNTSCKLVMADSDKASLSPEVLQS